MTGRRSLAGTARDPKSTVTASFESPVTRPSDDFGDFLRAGRLNVRYIVKKSAKRRVLVVLGALLKIPRRHAQIQRFLGVLRRKATAISILRYHAIAGLEAVSLR